jgi:fatty-acyl-CoA synthase
MLGLMQHCALTTGMLIDHAARTHGPTEIVSRAVDGSLERSDWANVAARSRRLAAALAALGAAQGDRIATLAWNRLPHLELYFGVTAAGMVLHTVNPRLFAEQIRYIIDHGGARILCVDPDLLPILEPLLPALTAVDHIIVLGGPAAMPAAGSRYICYETLLAAAEPVTSWPAFDENSASSLCYTSGTTGDPKGVLYSHRSTLLHAFAACATDSMALSARDSVLLVTPLFHVNAWGVPFAAAMCGAKLVLPGAQLDGASLYEMLRDERATFSLGVPTIWFALLDHIASAVGDTARDALSLTRVFVGGAAAPRALIERFRDLLGVELVQAWGMTETSPVATVCQPLARHAQLGPGAMVDLRATQGRAVFGVELRVDQADGAAPSDDHAPSGLLKVRGPWVLSGYFGDAPGSAVDAEGWFDTGDVARIDRDGYLHITDRAKDVIKSGGEWISSIDLENAAAAHPAVAEAAVIGVAHPRWQERPLLLLRVHPGQAVSREEMLDHLAGHVARWWLPDDVVTVDDLPHTATGKLLKTALRDQYRDHLMGG